MKIEWHSMEEIPSKKEGMRDDCILVLVKDKSYIHTFDYDFDTSIFKIGEAEVGNYKHMKDRFCSWSYVYGNPLFYYQMVGSLPNGYYLICRDMHLSSHNYGIRYIAEEHLVDFGRETCEPIYAQSRIIPLEEFNIKDYPNIDEDYQGVYDAWVQRHKDSKEKDYAPGVRVTYPDNKNVKDLKVGDLVVLLKDWGSFGDVKAGSRAVVSGKSNDNYQLNIEGHGECAWFGRDSLRLIASMEWEGFDYRR